MHILNAAGKADAQAAVNTPDSSNTSGSSTTSDRIVFDYVKTGGAMNGITAPVDSSGCASITQGTVTLELTLGDGSISVDEIEGIGAMAYVFR